MIDRISYRGRRNRSLKEINENINKYMKMSDAEFIMNYTDVYSKYEHKKLMFITISIGMMISMIMNIWNCFFDFLVSVFISKNAFIVNIKDQAIVLSLIVIVLVLVIIIVVLCSMIRTLYVLNKKKIFLDEIKDMRMLELSDKVILIGKKNIV